MIFLYWEDRNVTHMYVFMTRKLSSSRFSKNPARQNKNRQREHLKLFEGLLAVNPVEYSGDYPYNPLCNAKKNIKMDGGFTLLNYTAYM